MCLLLQAATYGGTYELVRHELTSLGITYTVFDQSDPSRWREALRPNTRVVYVEAISNPLLEVADFQARSHPSCGKALHQHNVHP
jgi:O-acetylhomoserine/O-acetylserine sulfhydrylase-like pyridoxal-dependent enzyme